MFKYFIILLLSVNTIFALQLDNLLKDIKKDAAVELQEERSRLQEFVNNEKEQKRLLAEAKKVLASENKKSENLKSTLEKNEVLLTEKEAVLTEKTGDLGEMFGSVRQTSADFLTNFQNSLTAAQDLKKEEIFEEFSNSKKLPNIEQLKGLWHGMLDEIIKSGNVEKFSADVILNNGEKVNEEVTRVGLFSARADGKYLNYSNEMKSLIELATQPTSVGSNPFSSVSSDENVFIVDPTRGTLFQLLNNQPTLKQRIQQGGIVGYIIIALDPSNEGVNGFVPVVNTRESENSYHIDVDLPGIKKEDISVDVDKNVLTISGERKTREEVKEEDYYKVETSFGKFSRSFTIPENTDIENINAKSNDGVLEIEIPKVEATKTKKTIAIN
eukprot:TRINITY_DN3180_c0_g1_i6.p1 TRINITY_DN3180_c0_g1~~TRINITY_DN3180_c0_g1_i6.p1  ORF type:complete len:385 (-),score=103.93 TRINITY_DN3180_c0_g1_i6:322-1476(-)